MKLTWVIVPALLLACDSSGGDESYTLLLKGSFTNHAGMVMVIVTNGLGVGKYEVTQKEYELVMGRNPSKFKAERNPVERVSWHDAMAFCRALTRAEQAAARKQIAYTLPTDQQWERFVGDASLDDAVYGRFGKNGENLGPLPVGSRKPNCFGLYDVRGNVWEWCLNEYMPNSLWKVLRGGAWSISDPENLAVSVRLNVEPETAYEFYGFRCVLAREATPP